MDPLAVAAVLVAAFTHATWNLAAKKAAASRHFVFLYSAVSSLLLAPVVLWVLIDERPVFETVHWVALLLTGALHMGYALLLQAGYRASDLSVVYPVARGTGPLLALFGAAALLGEPIHLLPMLGVFLVVGGIILVSGVAQRATSSWAGVGHGLMTGAFIASYTVNDGWAVKTLMISPVIVYFASDVLRLMLLSPLAMRDRATMLAEARQFAKPILIVSILAPLGYILVLFAMRLAPIGHVAAMRELATLIGVLFGAWLLREPSGWQRLAGASLVVAGVSAIAVTG